MTQVERPGEARTTLTAVAPDDLYEVVDGQLVEKAPLGAYEILLGSRLNTRLDSFADAQDYGRAVSEMLFHFGPSLPQRRPDVAYVSYERWPHKRQVPRTQAWAVVPELAVEVISANNTFEEVLGKVHEYFQAGVQAVWVVAPPQQQVYVYQSPSRIQVVTLQEALTGEPFLPGFRLTLAELFESIGISNAILPQSRRECALWVVEATGRIPNPSPSGWPCALPAASWPHGWRYRVRLARGDGQQTSAASSGGAAVRGDPPT